MHLFAVEGDKALGFAKCPLCGDSDFVIVNYEGLELKYSKDSPYNKSVVEDKVIFEENIDGDCLRVIQHSDNKRSLKINDVGYSCIYTDNGHRYEPAYRGIQEFIESVSLNIELKNICILGGGGGTLLRFLLKNIHSIRIIDCIEINPTIIYLCKKYFISDLLKQNSSKYNIIEHDAFEFIKSTRNLYNFIYVDLYIKDIIPTATFQEGFIKDLKDSLYENGIVAFNITLSDSENDLIEITKRYFSSCFILHGHAEEEKYVIMTDYELDFTTSTETL